MDAKEAVKARRWITMKVTIDSKEDPTLTILHKVLNDAPLDKLEIGPANNRIIIHGDFSNPEQFKARIDNAVEMLRHANNQLLPKD